MGTPAELIEELARQGREDVTGRVLTDWRAKGLMPGLVDHGRGQARGKVYEWNDPDIVARAIAVHDLLALTSSADTALVAIWIMGYEVSPERLRAAWARQSDKMSEAIDRTAGPDATADGVEDALSALVTPIARKASRDYGIARDKIEMGMEEAAKLMACREYDFDEIAKDVLIEDASRFFAATGWAGRNFPSLENMKWNEVVEFVREWVPIERTRAIVASAGLAEFKLARRHWLTFWELVIHIIPEWGEPRPGWRFKPSQVLSIAIGRQLIPMLLHLINAGHNSQIERTLSKAGGLIREFNCRDVYLALINRTDIDEVAHSAICGVLAELAEIWGEGFLSLFLNLPTDAPVAEYQSR